MSTENLKQGSVVTDTISMMLRNGENEKALAYLEQNYGPIAKNAMEKVMKYSNLSQDELVRVFAKVSDILENVAEKIEKNEKLNAIKEKMATEMELKEDAEEAAYMQAEALARQKRFEERIKWMEEQKKKMAEEKRQLEEQYRRERDIEKRKEIERKMKALEKRRKHLEEERKNLEELKQQNATRDYSQDTQKTENKESSLQAESKEVHKEEQSISPQTTSKQTVALYKAQRSIER